MRDKLSRRPDTRALYSFDRHGDVVEAEVYDPNRATAKRPCEPQSLFDRHLARRT